MQYKKYSDGSVGFELKSGNYIADATLLSGLAVLIRNGKFEFLRFMSSEGYDKKDIKEIIEYMKDRLYIAV